MNLCFFHGTRKATLGPVESKMRGTMHLADRDFPSDIQNVVGLVPAPVLDEIVLKIGRLRLDTPEIGRRQNDRRNAISRSHQGRSS